MRVGMRTTERMAGRKKSGIHIAAGWETVGTGTRCRKSGQYRRREHRPRSGRGREVAVSNEMHSGFPFPSRPVPDPTTFLDPTTTALTLVYLRGFG